MNSSERRQGKKNYSKVSRGLTAVTASSFLAATSMSSAAADTVCNVSTLSQLQAAGSNADCDIINVNSNISFDPLEEDSQTVLINHSALISGNITIDGNRTGRMFAFSETDIEVTFQGLNLIDGGVDVEDWQEYADLSFGGFYLSGGAISTFVGEGGFYNSNELILDGVTIENSSAVFGGAIGLGFGSSLTLTGNTSYFIDNSAYIGGAISAIYFTDSDLKNAVFEGNTALIGGAIGALFLADISTSEGVRFEDNYALSGGAMGAFILNRFDIRDSYFVNNRAFDSIEELPAFDSFDSIGDGGDLLGLIGTGGAISGGVAGFVYIENSTFFNNTADVRGGAVFLGEGSVQVILSTFMNNSTAPSAGEDSGASIFSAGATKIFGNIFASDHLSRGHLNSVGGEGDLGGNLSTSGSDTALFTHSLSSIVSFSELKMSNMPSTDSSHPNSAPFLPIENTSIAADAVDLDLLSASLPSLSFPDGRLFPTQDQRGVERSGKFDAGSYEIGERGLDIVPMVKKIVLPSAPGRVNAKNEGRKAIRVEWTLPTSAGTGRITKYEIYRNGLKIATIASNKRYYIDRGLDSNQSYTYQIVSVGTQGNSIKSQQSSSIFPRRILPTVNK